MKKGKKKPGPRPFPKNSRRNYRMQVLLNSKERDDIELAAARGGLPVAVWVRNRLRESIIESENSV